MAGREGLVDTAVKTAETGYMQVTVNRTEGFITLERCGYFSCASQGDGSGRSANLVCFQCNRVIYTVKYMACSVLQEMGSL